MSCVSSIRTSNDRLCTCVLFYRWMDGCEVAMCQADLSLGLTAAERKLEREYSIV